MGTIVEVTAEHEIPQVTAEESEAWEAVEVTEAWDDLQKRVTDAVLRGLYIEGKLLGRRVG